MRLIVGDETGLIKVVCPENRQIQKYGVQARVNGITQMCWSTAGDSDVAVATTTGMVNLWSFEETAKVATFPAASPTVGLHMFDREESNILVTCSEDGQVSLRRRGGEGEGIEVVATHDLGSKAGKFRVSPGNRLFGYGGKDVDLHLLDLETFQPVFNAKNVKNDFLDLRVPVWLTDMAFIDDSLVKLVTSTGHGHVRLYDTRAQRRPIMSATLSDTRLMNVAVEHGHNWAVAGDAKGKVSKVDLRTGRPIGSFKGAVGSVRAIAFHPHLNCLATASLDRWLRIYDVNKRQLIYKVYLKQRLNTLLFCEDDMILPTKASDTTTEHLKRVVAKKDKAEVDSLWDTLKETEQEEGGEDGGDGDFEEVDSEVEAKKAAAAEEKKKRLLKRKEKEAKAAAAAAAEDGDDDDDEDDDGGADDSGMSLRVRSFGKKRKSSGGSGAKGKKGGKSKK